ncbi:mycothiol transferase [Pseudonocardia pini]|uniref:mycothiol transferase n=1 Tax=Pseudonocardia pini TaxID=2758030 RepID=UPI0028B2314D|nr:DUF664 domain-containing protein [Pseudonocardia pini]
MLQAQLDRRRATLLRICAGLTAEQLAARPLPSALSLLGLVRHLAKVDRVWLRQRVAGREIEPLHGGPGDPTDSAAADPARAADEVAALQAERAASDAAAAGVPLDREIDFRGEPTSVRTVYTFLLVEYARHNGHADLLREALDGVTGR